LSLFSKLLKLRPSDSQKAPLEDFFTEIVVHLFNLSPDLLRRWIASLNLFDVSDAAAISIISQPTYDRFTGKAFRSRPDMLIQIDTGDTRDWIFLESKIGSQEGPDQLQRYAEILDSIGHIRYKGLLYVTRDYEPKAQSEIFKNIPETRVRFKQLRWYAFYNFLSQQSPNLFTDEVLSFMKEYHMAQNYQFTSAELVALSNMPNALSMLDETLLGEVRDRFSRAIGPLDLRPQTVFKQLILGRRYLLYAWLGNDFWSGLGYLFPINEYPRLTILVEVGPRAGRRTEILEAMQEIVTSQPTWKGHGLNSSDWASISISNSLAEFLGTEDHVNEIKNHFLERISELEELTLAYPELPWKMPTPMPIEDETS
jgi:hypothetical protein